MSRASLFVGVAVLCVTSTAQADPLRITSGFVFLAPQNAQDADFRLRGNDFDFGAQEVEDQPIVVPPAPGVLQTGTPVDLSAYSVIGQNDGGFPARGTFNGSPVLVGGPMSLNAAATFLSCGPSSGVAISCAADAPFAFSADLTFTDASTRAPLFTRPFTGHGRVHGLLWNDGYNVENHLALRYTFDVAPVPEPGTLLLLTSGIGAACMRAVRRRRSPRVV
jgi:hypothetical protein